MYFVMNDSNAMLAYTPTHPLGIEIHGMAYGYQLPNDSTLNNSLFMHYDIINRSADNYHDAYIGFFADFDIGSPHDDYQRCYQWNDVWLQWNSA